MEQNWDKEEDDIEDAEMPELLNKKAALQFWDAVEQFKQHYPWREKAKGYADKGEWQECLPQRGNGLAVPGQMRQPRDFCQENC